MQSAKATARLAGLLYLIIIFLGMFYLRYVPVKLNVSNDTAATLKNITGNETLYRLGILAEIIADVIFLLLSLTLYKIFSQVNRIHALLMVIFVAFSVMISFISLQYKFAVLSLIDKNIYAHLLTADAFKAQAQSYFDLYHNGILSGELFWGLWLFPLGYLMIKSGYMPKFIGVLLIAGCFGYVIDFAGSFLFPGYNKMTFADQITLPASIGELCTCLWLLIMGVKTEKQPKTIPHHPL
jgi:hypothetical protein